MHFFGTQFWSFQCHFPHCSAAELVEAISRRKSDNRRCSGISPACHHHQHHYHRPSNKWSWMRTVSQLQFGHFGAAHQGSGAVQGQPLRRWARLGGKKRKEDKLEPMQRERKSGQGFPLSRAARTLLLEYLFALWGIMSSSYSNVL